MWIDLDVQSGAGLALRQLAMDSAKPLQTARVWTQPMMRALVWTWLSLNIAGQVLLLLLLVTFFFGRRLRSKRHPTVLNFVFTHLLSTIPACLLFYGNVHLNNQPDPWLCLYNAALMSGVPPMVAVSFFAVVLQVYSLMRCVAAQKEYVQRTWVTVVLIAMPYVAFVAFGLVTGIIGFNDPKNVTRTEIVFCSVRHHNLGLYIWIPTVCVGVATMGVGVALVILLWRNWRDVKGNSVVDFNLIVRALCFTVFQMFSIVTLMLAVFADSTVPKFMQAVTPIGVFLIFSTQPDVIHSWFPCLSKRRDLEGMVRASSMEPESRPPVIVDNEKFAMEYPLPTNASSTPSALRGVPGLRLSIIGLPQPTAAAEYPGPSPSRTQTPVSGLRTLALANSSSSSPRSMGRPTHSPSLSEVSNPITLRPEPRPRAPGLQHGRGNSVASSYSDLSWRSGRSGAPLIRNIDGARRPSESQSSSYRSDTGVLGNAPYEYNSRV